VIQRRPSGKASDLTRRADSGPVTSAGGRITRRATVNFTCRLVRMQPDRRVPSCFDLNHGGSKLERVKFIVRSNVA